MLGFVANAASGIVTGTAAVVGGGGVSPACASVARGGSSTRAAATRRARIAEQSAYLGARQQRHQPGRRLFYLVSPGRKASLALRASASAQGDDSGRGVGANGAALASSSSSSSPLSESASGTQLKVLIANRGEIAVRAIRSCRELGIETVAVHSVADADSLAVQLADESVCIGPAPSSESYLNMPAILSACEVTGANAVYPGFGFLSESAKFAELLEEHGITFIGPSSEAISMMGDKASAKETMINAGVPTVPGSRGLLESEQHALRAAAQIGYPVMLKATAGGGGRGIRVVHKESELLNAYRTCRQEAEGAFGNGALYMEKFVESPRHVEIQVVGDAHGNAIYLGERDCSVQRRNQKLLEEAPSPAVSPELRKRMGEAACRAATAIGYAGAGTVEYIMSADGEFYFMEMNTRIQVEHPVTEMITGLDIVALQILVAQGKPLPLAQHDVRINGWAMEARINCEDVYHNFRPSPGTVTAFLPPGGNGVRWDGAVYAGYAVPPFYDSMLGKLICWAPTRDAVIRKMKRALAELVVSGVPTTVPFHRKLLENAAFNEGSSIFTNFIEREGIMEQLKADKAAAAAAATAGKATEAATAVAAAGGGGAK